jgi:CRP/FNR family transcriptional regulator, dissimilatory nitrate respiration regulator
MDYVALSETAMFRGASPEQVEAMLTCLQATERSFEKGAYLLHQGEHAQALGLVVSGGVRVETCDVWGNVTVLGHADAGQVFAEAYACVPQEELMVNVVALEPTRALFMDVCCLMSPCTRVCAHHASVMVNLLQILAQNNLGLSRRSFHTTPKTIRGKLVSYLSYQAQSAGSDSFHIPYNRQQLADYLGVDRSALSNELSKMQKEGLLKVRKNEFKLLG